MKGMRRRSERDIWRCDKWCAVVAVVNTQGEPIRGSQTLHKCPLLGWSNINKTHHPKVKANGAVGIVNIAPLKFFYSVS